MSNSSSSPQAKQHKNGTNFVSPVETMVYCLHVNVSHISQSNGTPRSVSNCFVLTNGRLLV